MSSSARAHTGTHQTRLERLRGSSDRTVAALRFAEAVEECADEAAEELAQACRMLEEEAIAWLVLCDRGWPNGLRPAENLLPSARAWMAAWSEFVALPPRPSGTRESNDSREICRMLESEEKALRLVLPADVWSLVNPLDGTGRATLASLLQSIAVWSAAHVRALGAAQRTVHVRERFDRLSGELSGLGLLGPSDPLDVELWRAIAATARKRASQGAGSPPA